MDRRVASALEWGYREPVVPDHVTTQGGQWTRTLDAIMEHAERLPVTRKSDLGPGDRVIVSTRNSTYCLHALGDGTFCVSGGWFERHSCSKLVTVNGCTYGGRAIRTDIVAAPGLFLEFGNNVSTTRIQRVQVVRHLDRCGHDRSDLPN
jgi:hypothetical protein